MTACDLGTARSGPVGWATGRWDNGNRATAGGRDRVTGNRQAEHRAARWPRRARGLDQVRAVVFGVLVVGGDIVVVVIDWPVAISAA